MSKIVEVPDDVYARIEKVAAVSDMTVEEWIASLFPEPTVWPAANGGSANGGREMTNGDVTAAVSGAGSEQRPRTLADEFAGRVGLVSSGRSDLSERVSELFAQGMLEKQRTGHL